MSKILTLKTILTKNIFKKKDKTDGCMRRLQQVSNINIINTKLITVTDIDSMSLHTGDRGNDKFWPFEWKEQKIVSYIIRFDWFCSTCLFINSFILLEDFFSEMQFYIAVKIIVQFGAKSILLFCRSVSSETHS